MEDLWERAAPRPVQPAGIVDVEGSGLMDFMIDLCDETFYQSLALFPPGKESSWGAKAVTDTVTGEIFSRAVGALGSVWMAVAGVGPRRICAGWGKQRMP